MLDGKDRGGKEGESAKSHEDTQAQIESELRKRDAQIRLDREDGAIDELRREKWVENNFSAIEKWAEEDNVDWTTIKAVSDCKTKTRQQQVMQHYGGESWGTGYSTDEKYNVHFVTLVGCRKLTVEEDYEQKTKISFTDHRIYSYRIAEEIAGDFDKIISPRRETAIKEKQENDKIAQEKKQKEIEEERDRAEKYKEKKVDFKEGVEKIVAEKTGDKYYLFGLNYTEAKALREEWAVAMALWNGIQDVRTAKNPDPVAAVEMIEKIMSELDAYSGPKNEQEKELLEEMQRIFTTKNSAFRFMEVRGGKVVQCGQIENPSEIPCYKKPTQVIKNGLEFNRNGRDYTYTFPRDGHYLLGCNSESLMEVEPLPNDKYKPLSKVEKENKMDDDSSSMRREVSPRIVEPVVAMSTSASLADVIAQKGKRTEIAPQPQYRLPDVESNELETKEVLRIAEDLSQANALIQIMEKELGEISKNESAKLLEQLIGGKGKKGLKENLAELNAKLSNGVGSDAKKFRGQVGQILGDLKRLDKSILKSCGLNSDWQEVYESIVMHARKVANDYGVEVTESQMKQSQVEFIRAARKNKGRSITDETKSQTEDILNNILA